MNLQVKDVKVHVIGMEAPQIWPFHGSKQNDLGGTRKRYLGLLRIITEEGLEGHAFVGTKWTDNPRGISPLTEVLKPFLVGQDALDREWLWQQFRQMASRWDVNESALMAADVAIWDLAAKAAGLPLYKLLGTYRHKVLAYGSAPYQPEGEVNVQEALASKEQGFRAYKLHHAIPDLRNVVDVCTKVRQAVGEEMVLAFDCLGVYNFQEALYVGRALDELGFQWYEDPMKPNELVALAELSRRLDVPIAISDKPEFRFADASNAIHQQAARIMLGDVKKDGVTGIKKLAALCEAHHLNTLFHYGGNSSFNAATLHVTLSVKNSDYFPMFLSGDNNQGGLVEDPKVDSEGYVHGPQKPGLGVDIDWEFMDRYTEAVL